MLIRIIDYSFEHNIYSCVHLDTGCTHLIDPFITCAIEQTDEDYHNHKGRDLIGNVYEIENDCYITNELCDFENFGKGCMLLPNNMKLVGQLSYGVN